MLNTMMENENTSFANISIPFLRSCSQHLRKGVEILAKLVFLVSIIVFNMMKLPFILFIMKVISQINIFILLAFAIPAIFHVFLCLNSLKPKLPSYRNQSIDLQRNIFATNLNKS